MSMSARRWAARLALLLVLLEGLSARAQTPQEKKRSDILKDLGLQKKPVATPPPPALPPPADTAEERLDAPAAPGTKPKGKPAGPAAPSFARAIHPALITTCKPCHAPGAPGGLSRFLLSGDPAADHAAAVRFVDRRNAEGSVLLAKVSGGTPHAGGPLWPAASAPYERVLAWIRGGARLDAAAPAAPVEPPAKPMAPPAPRRPAPGIPATPALPPAPAEAPASPTPPVPTAAPAQPAPATFASTVHPILMSACAACHKPGGPAAMTRLLLAGDAAQDEASARAFVDLGAPAASPLVVKASGQMHGGGPVLPPGDARLATLLAWANEVAAPAPPQTPAPGTPVPAPAPIVAAAPAPAAPLGHGPHRGLELPLGFFVNGRFSLDFERRQFTGGPFGDDSVNALRSYHHFLFLSRDVAGEPCGLSLEVVTLQFWEAHCRVPRLPAPLRLTIVGGKIVVPFGADPLYHQMYGGLAGFDQQVLPVLWAVEGAAARLVFARRALVVTDDLFVVRGYAIPRADAAVNLQSGFSPDDDTRLGVGNRLGVAWMFASAWYSAYYNPLGFGRRLFMQALDVSVSRPRGVPVLEHFSLGVGLLRADVSGGGPGVGGVGYDYYDFADYLQLRYYPFDWLYVQYRTGLRTFENRRGVVVDNTRLTRADASTHNFAVVARHHGLTAGLYYFINLEKVDEVPNDLLRLSVTYEF
jgi:hypothetical protein